MRDYRHPNYSRFQIMTHSILAQAADSVSYWPLGILAISVGFIVFTIIKLKLHPFLALIFAAVLTGLPRSSRSPMEHSCDPSRDTRTMC